MQNAATARATSMQRMQVSPSSPCSWLCHHGCFFAMMALAIGVSVTSVFQNEIQRVQATLKNKLHVEKKKESDERLQLQDAPDPNKSPPHMSQFVRSQVPLPPLPFPGHLLRAPSLSLPPLTSHAAGISYSSTIHLSAPTPLCRSCRAGLRCCSDVYVRGSRRHFQDNYESLNGVRAQGKFGEVPANRTFCFCA